MGDNENGQRLLSTEQQKLRPSYFFKTGDFVLSHARLGDLIDKAAEEAGDRLAFVSCHQKIQKTFREFKNEVDKLASGLLSIGLRKGDHVGLCAPNIYEWPVVQYATAKAGLVLVNVNPAYRANELQYCMEKVGCRAFITIETFKSYDFYEMLCSFIPELEGSRPGGLQSSRLPDLRCVILISEKARSGTLTYQEVLNAGDSKSDELLRSMEEIVQFDDPVNMQFTSGTTGVPKAAVLTHHNIVNNAIMCGRRLGYHERMPILCCQVPLYHCFGCVLGTLASVLFQYTCVFPSPTFNVGDSLMVIQDMGCTTVYGTPTMLVDMINKYRSGNYNTKSLTQVLTGGAPIPQSLLRELYEEMKIHSLHIAYGLTESSPGVSMSYLSDSLETISARRIAPLEYVEFKVADRGGRVLPLGTPGEMCVRGHVVFWGYWKQESKEAQVIDKAKWLHTGDMVKMYENGYIEVVGRFKDVVIRGGENIYPAEVENFLHEHPNILEVHICGVPDKRMGEELCAWIRTKDEKKLTENDVKSYCKGKISHFKIPRYIIFVDDFPKTMSGKVQKFKMRKISMEKLNLS